MVSRLMIMATSVTIMAVPQTPSAWHHVRTRPALPADDEAGMRRGGGGGSESEGSLAAVHSCCESVGAVGPVGVEEAGVKGVASV